MIGSHEDWGDTVSIESRGWRGVAGQSETQVEEHTEYDKVFFLICHFRGGRGEGGGKKRCALYIFFELFGIKIR